MNAAALKRLFGDGDGVGTGPSTWMGGDAFQTRKAKRCEPCNRYYSVEVDSCPHCDAKAMEKAALVVAKKLRHRDYAREHWRRKNGMLEQPRCACGVEVRVRDSKCRRCRMVADREKKRRFRAAQKEMQ